MADDHATILFVDDEPHVLDGIRRQLRGANAWRVLNASSVEEAIRLSKIHSPDVVVSDVSMPIRDGFDLLASFRTDVNLQHIPIIILTGLGDTELKRRALKMGAVDLLSKPIQTPDLLARIESVLKIKCYEDRLRDQAEALEQAVRERTAQLEASRLEIILRLAMAGEYRDTDTGMHIARVAHLSCAIGDGLGLTADQQRRLFAASTLHDIGKIALPDDILRKAGPLTDEERLEMQKHCCAGYDILRSEDFGELQSIHRSAGRSSNELLEVASAIALCHHERWDGTGYPRKLAGTDIPIEARVVAAADILDAMASRRCYKPALPLSLVREHLHALAGHHLDPSVVAAVDAKWDELSDICVRLADASAIVAQEVPVPAAQPGRAA